jgi:hypothetical protein
MQVEELLLPSAFVPMSWQTGQLYVPVGRAWAGQVQASKRDRAQSVATDPLVPQDCRRIAAKDTLLPQDRPAWSSPQQPRPHLDAAVPLQDRLVGHRGRDAQLHRSSAWEDMARERSAKGSRP